MKRILLAITFMVIASQCFANNIGGYRLGAPKDVIEMSGATYVKTEKGSAIYTAKEIKGDGKITLYVSQETGFLQKVMVQKVVTKKKYDEQLNKMMGKGFLNGTDEKWKIDSKGKDYYFSLRKFSFSSPKPHRGAIVGMWYRSSGKVKLAYEYSISRMQLTHY